MYSLEYYIDANGKVVLNEWRRNLPDKRASARIASRLERLQYGSFGDCKPIGEGVWELRVDCGPGYRVYYSIIGKTVVLLLCGGDKRKQNSDIERAIAYLRDYKRREYDNN